VAIGSPLATIFWQHISFIKFFRQKFWNEMLIGCIVSMQKFSNFAENIIQFM
jgi:hypothetical protein